MYPLTFLINPITVNIGTKTCYATLSSTDYCVGIILTCCVSALTYIHLRVLHRTQTSNFAGVISIRTCSRGISVTVNNVKINRLVLERPQKKSLNEC